MISRRISKRVLALSLASLLVLLLVPNNQVQAQEDEINVSLRVNYGAAYRNKTWVPIDILVDNQVKDIDGYIEVTMLDFTGASIGPRYRVPAESAKFSRKRFRLTCYMQGVDRIRAQVYHKRRPVLARPLSIQALPIKEEDFLCLVLDDKPEFYGFLSTSVLKNENGFNNVRFHRESLTSSELPDLADHLACYDAFDLIILGEIDPGRISAHHRELLKQYVEQGGNVVIGFGAHAGPYKGSWVEEWLGVTLGNSAVYNGVELAEAVYGNKGEARSEREAFVTQMIPRDDSVRVREGVTPILEAVRPYGTGHVIGIAIDAESQVLQRHKEYQQFWNEIIKKSYRGELNFPLAARFAATQLPAVAGVELFPVSSVILYLVLYFVIAIVGNWLFWNYFKRRELAWVCLVIFSFGFTGYAMVFGTQGRAKATEIERIEVLELSANSKIATLHTLTGVLADSTGSYSGSLENSDALVMDAEQDNNIGYANQTRRQRFSGPRPFTFVQDEKGRIENMRIGASEMRFLQIRQTVNLNGVIDAELSTENGRLTGTITNQTGLELDEAQLFYNAQFYTLQQTGDGWRVGTSVENRELSRFDQWLRGGYYYDSNTIEPFKRDIRNALFYEYDNMANATRVISHSPCIVGWAKGEPHTKLDMDQDATMNISATLVVAGLRIDDQRNQDKQSPLQVSIYSLGNTNTTMRRGSEDRNLDYWINSASLIDYNNAATLTIISSTPSHTFESGKVILDFYATTDPDVVKKKQSLNSNVPSPVYYPRNTVISEDNNKWRVGLRNNSNTELTPDELTVENLSGIERVKATYTLNSSQLTRMNRTGQLSFTTVFNPEGFSNSQESNRSLNAYPPLAVISAIAEFIPNEKTDINIEYTAIFN